MKHAALIFIFILFAASVQAQTWTFVDGNTASGMNYNSSHDAMKPAIATNNGKLYIAWAETTATVAQIRVKEYNGSSWSWVDGGGTTGINVSTSHNAGNVALISYNNKLYAAWDEYFGGIANAVHIKRFDGGSTWTSVDASSSYGMNWYTALGNLGNANNPSMVVCNGYLYMVWDEALNNLKKIRAKRYDGTTWSTIDGDDDSGLAFNSAYAARYAKLGVFNSTVYATWAEWNSSSIFQIRVRRYDGGSTWTFVDGNTANGLNFDAAYQAMIPNIAATSNALYVTWYESGSDGGEYAHLKVFNNPGWGFVDGNTMYGLERRPGGDYFSLNPNVFGFYKLLYTSWGDENNGWVTQTRVMSYDGITKTFIDGNAYTGLNYDTTRDANARCITNYDGNLYVAWTEEATEDIIGGTLRVKRCNMPPAPPQNPVITDSSASQTVAMKWSKNSESNVARYYIYRGTAINPTTKVDSSSASASDTTKTMTGLTNGTRYYFRITAVNASGDESDYSSNINVIPNDRTAPAAPQSLAVTDSSLSQTVTITWKKNSESDVARYRIYRSTTPAPTTKVDSSASASDTSKTFTGLTNGTRYYFRITAVDNSGNESVYSNEVNAMPNNAPTPVEITSFTISSSQNTVTFRWTTATEINNYGFEVERRVVSTDLSQPSPQRGGQGWGQIGFVQGNGTSNIAHSYCYIDQQVLPGTYAYRLKQIDNDGTCKYSGETEAAITAPEKFALNQNFPNPFNPTTTISYDVPDHGSPQVVTIKVYDVMGRVIATLVNEAKPAGSYTAIFNASQLPSGVYYYELLSDNYKEVKKLLLVK